MNVLLDTCALLALARGELPREAAAALRSAAEAHVSVVTAWEVAIKVARGRLQLKAPPAAWFQGLAERYKLSEVPLDFRIACAAAALPAIHGDPFDRVLVALAQAHGLTILTSDGHIPQYPGVKALW
ncbi:MAG TPA: type II toxin-antitoxin system VapC family toxin [Vicinamibacterales bacterium]|nr:type II toxin-antitoxin system VapC family toxin [Vicinamibacterales bacterium]